MKYELAQALLFFFALGVVVALSAGALIGLTTGLLGVTGINFVLLPPLLKIFTGSQGPSVLSIGSSVCSLLALSVAAFCHHRRGAVDWRAAGVLGGTMILLLMALRYVRIRPELALGHENWAGWMRFAPGMGALALALVLAACAAWMLFGKPVEPREERPGPAALTGMSLCLLLVIILPYCASVILRLCPPAVFAFWLAFPLLFAMLLVVPCLLGNGVTMRRAVGTSAAALLIALPFGAARSLPLQLRHLHVDPVIFYGCLALAACTSILCAWLGVKLAHRLPERRLKAGYAVLLCVVAAEICRRALV